MRKKLLAPSRRSFLIGSGAGLIAAPSIARAAGYFFGWQAVAAPIGTIYAKSSWADLSEFTINNSSATIVNGAIRINPATQGEFTQNIQLKQTGGVFPGATDDENIDFSITAKCGTIVAGLGLGFNAINTFVPINLVADFAPSLTPNALAYFWGGTYTSITPSKIGSGQA